MATEIKKAQVKWVEGLKFVGTGHSGRSIVMDASSKVGGDASAVMPGEMVLISLGGCTGMDVVSILKKMKVPFRDVRVEVEAEPVETHPKIYRWIKITYRFFGVADKNKAERAVKLSQEKYCSVAAILSKSAEVSYEIVFED